MEEIKVVHCDMKVDRDCGEQKMTGHQLVDGVDSRALNSYSVLKNDDATV